MNDVKCNHCGAKEFEVYHQVNDLLYSKKRNFIFKKRRRLHYDVCIKCGTIHRFFILKSDE